jgi:hypothetical protein
MNNYCSPEAFSIKFLEDARQECVYYLGETGYIDQIADIQVDPLTPIYGTGPSGLHLMNPYTKLICSQ